MTAAQAMRQLLAQHEQLRDRMADVWIIARVGASGKKVSDLRGRVEALRSAFLKHEADEERLLKPLLTKRQAHGPQPLEYLGRHRDEVHDTLCRAIEETTTEGITEIERSLAILALVRQLREHMRREEREFITELSTDHYVTDGFGG